MKGAATNRRWLLWLSLGLPLLFVVLAGGAYLLLNAWLASAGGRDAVAAQLSERIGLPVVLQGDFEVMLWPSIGASGTGLRMGSPGVDEEIISSGRYEVAIALKPLLKRQLVIETVHLEDGIVYPDRYQGRQQVRPGKEAEKGGFVLPDIDHLQLDQFQLVIPGKEETRLQVNSLSLSDFTAGQATPFAVEFEEFGSLQGTLTWVETAQQLVLKIDWAMAEVGTLALDAAILLDPVSGYVNAGFESAERQQTIELEAEFGYWPGQFSLPRIEMQLMGQPLVGEGCLLLTPAPEFNLDIKAELLDLDSILDSLPEFGSAGPAGEVPLAAVNMRLEAQELRTQGAVVREAVVHVGRPPGCN